MYIKNKIYDYIILFLCVAIGVTFLFVLNNYLGNGADEEFQTICVRRYNEAPLGLLVFWIGYLWTDLFGFTLLNLRNLTSIEYVLTMVVTTTYLYHQTRNVRLTGLVFLLGCVLIRLGSFCIYNWDSGTYLFDAIALCLLMSLMSRPNIRKAFLLGFSIGLMTLGRTPSVIYLPIVCFLVWLLTKKDEDKRIRTRLFVMITAGWLIAMLLFTTVILGSPWKYISLFANGNVISGHSPSNDGLHLWFRFKLMLKLLPSVCFFGAVTLLVTLLITKIKNQISASLILILWLLLCVLSSYWMSRHGFRITQILGMDTPLGLGLLLALPIYNLFGGKIKCDRPTQLKLWGCFLTVFSFAFGSDAYQERWIFAFTIPVILAVLWKLPSKTLKRFLKYFVFISTLIFSSMWFVHVISNKTLYKDYVKSDLPLLKGLYLAEERKMKLEKINDFIVGLRSEGVPYVFAGDHLLSEMLAGEDEGVSFHLYHVNISIGDHWENYRDTALNKVDAVLFYPGDFSDYNENIFADLEEEGFVIADRFENIYVYRRSLRKNPDKQYEILEISKRGDNK